MVIYFDSEPRLQDKIKGFFTGKKPKELTKFQLMLKSFRECSDDAELMALYTILRSKAKDPNLQHLQYTQTDRFDPRWPSILCTHKMYDPQTRTNIDIRFNHTFIDEPIRASHVRFNDGLFYSFCGDYNIFQNLLQKISGAPNYLTDRKYLGPNETHDITMQLAREIQQNQKQH